MSIRRRAALGTLTAFLILVAPGVAQAASTWTQLHPAESPSARSLVGMAYDPASQQVVLFGGYSGRSSLGDTWLWNAWTWSQTFPSTAPPARDSEQMAYDAASGQLLMFGGHVAGVGGLSDTWVWSRGVWTQLHPASSPPNRDSAAFAYDPATRQLVMFGGFQYSPGVLSGNLQADTWAWNGTTWTQLHPAASPPAVYGASLAWDPALNRLVLFGGGQNDTWSWDGTTWTKLALTVEPPRSFAAMATDPGTQQVLLAGGAPQTSGVALGETWTFQSTWIQQHPPTAPSARQGAAAAFDPGSGHLLLYGGASTGVLGDTWVWGPLAVDQPPPPAATTGLNYRIFLQAIGGVGPLTWSLVSGTLPAGLSLFPATGELLGTPTRPGAATFTVRVTDSSTPTPQTATKTFTIVVLQGPKPGVYVANGANSAINAFAFGASGNATPTATIAGPHTGLNGPSGLAFDTQGDLYVANSNTPAILDYQAGSYGDVTPLRTITGPATGLAGPSGLTVDTFADVYVANTPANSVTEYWPGASGNAAPRHTITGPDTGLSSPRAVVLDAGGHLWVANAGNNTLTEYPAGADGDTAPMAIIAGPTTGLNSPQALTQDSLGELVVANTLGESITRYSNPGPTGGVFPASQITGPATQLSFPDGIDVDAANRLYVANQFGGINIYTSLGPADNVAPLAIISGPATGLAAPAALAVTPPMTITTRTLPAAGLGERYRTAISQVLGVRPVRFRVTRGHLPAGVRLTPSGHLVGTPRRTRTFRFMIRATDSTRPAVSATRALTLKVIRPAAVIRVLPPQGSRRGGTRVTILGTGMSTRRGATTIWFGTTPALDARCPSHRRCLAIAPPHRRGAVTVTARTLGVEPAHAGAAGFSYR